MLNNPTEGQAVPLRCPTSRKRDTITSSIEWFLRFPSPQCLSTLQLFNVFFVTEQRGKYDYLCTMNGDGRTRDNRWLVMYGWHTHHWDNQSLLVQSRTTIKCFPVWIFSLLKSFYFSPHTASNLTKPLPASLHTGKLKKKGNKSICPNVPGL